MAVGEAGEQDFHWSWGSPSQDSNRRNADKTNPQITDTGKVFNTDAGEHGSQSGQFQQKLGKPRPHRLPPQSARPCTCKDTAPVQDRAGAPRNSAFVRRDQPAGPTIQARGMGSTSPNQGALRPSLLFTAWYRHCSHITPACLQIR